MGRKLFYGEEEEVEHRDVNKDVDLFQSACADIQRTITEIDTLKENKGTNSVCFHFIYANFTILTFDLFSCIFKIDSDIDKSLTLGTVSNVVQLP